MTASSRLPLQAVMLLAVLLAAAGCAEAPRYHRVPTPAEARAANRPAATAAAPTNPGPSLPASAAALGPNGKPLLFNDPPAAPDTPLCGHEARELNAIGAGLQGARVAASGICATFACYDPLTATYIGADGYRHVCR